MKKAGLETGLLFFEAAERSMLLQYGQNLTFRSCGSAHQMHHAFEYLRPAIIVQHLDLVRIRSNHCIFTGPILIFLTCKFYPSIPSINPDNE